MTNQPHDVIWASATHVARNKVTSAHRCMDLFDRPRWLMDNRVAYLVCERRELEAGSVSSVRRRRGHAGIFPTPMPGAHQAIGNDSIREGRQAWMRRLGEPMR